jgi:DnaJ-class molecular chaperone
MAQEIELFLKCVQCNGTGVFQSAHGPGSGSIPCNWPGCNGTGFISKGKFIIDPGNDDVADKCDDILEKCGDILAKLNE